MGRTAGHKTTDPKGTENLLVGVVSWLKIEEQSGRVDQFVDLLKTSVSSDRIPVGEST